MIVMTDHNMTLSCHVITVIGHHTLQLEITNFVIVWILPKYIANVEEGEELQVRLNKWIYEIHKIQI